jgi:hypothetical protein
MGVENMAIDKMPVDEMKCYHDTTPILMKPLLIMTLLITLISVTLHISFLFTAESKVIYKYNKIYECHSL